MLYAFVQVMSFFTLFAYVYVCIISNVLWRDILHSRVIYFRKKQSDNLK